MQGNYQSCFLNGGWGRKKKSNLKDVFTKLLLYQKSTVMLSVGVTTQW